jgi:hypothetical protein
MKAAQPHHRPIAAASQRRFDAWLATGLSCRASVALVRSGCDTAEDVARLGKPYFIANRKLGLKTLEEIGVVGGWVAKKASVTDVIAAALLLSISDPEEAQEAALDVLSGLHRCGFVLSLSRADARA